MTVVTSPGDVAHPFTVTDPEGMPDDGRRYELIDGEHLVSPAPGAGGRLTPAPSPAPGALIGWGCASAL